MYSYCLQRCRLYDSYDSKAALRLASLSRLPLISYLSRCSLFLALLANFVLHLVTTLASIFPLTPHKVTRSSVWISLLRKYRNI